LNGGDEQSAYVSRAVVGHGGNGGGNSKNEVVNVSGLGVGWSRGYYSAHVPYPAHHQVLPYQHDHCLHAGLIISSILSLFLHSHLIFILYFETKYIENTNSSTRFTKD
jgi:hypothetical protein